MLHTANTALSDSYNIAVNRDSVVLAAALYEPRMRLQGLCVQCPDFTILESIHLRASTNSWQICAYLGLHAANMAGIMDSQDNVNPFHIAP